MNYRQFLIDRHGLPPAADPDPRILDYMSLRNRDSMSAWQQRMSQTAQASSADLKVGPAQQPKRFSTSTSD